MLRSLFVFLGICSLTLAKPYCEVPDDIAVELRRSGNLAEQPGTQSEVKEKRLAIFEALLKRYPDDLQANRELIIYGIASRDALIERYKARLDSSPNDALSLYLYALTIVDRDTSNAIPLIEQALRNNPELAWPHVDLARLDRAAVTKHIDAFFSMCPTVQNSGALSLLELHGSPEVQLLVAKALRQRLATEPGPGRLGAYASLWHLEFKVYPPSQHAQLREQVASDLRSMRQRLPNPNLSQLRSMRLGFQLTGDSAGLTAIDQEIRQFPR